MRFLLGMLLAVRGIERNGGRRLPQLLRSDPEVAEKLDAHTAQLSHVEVELAELADGNRREHEALAMIAGEFRRLREEEQALRRRQAESLEVAAVALTRLADGQRLAGPIGMRDESDALRAELEQQRAHLEAAHEELQQLRAANTRITDELRAAHSEAQAGHRDATEQLEALQETHRHTEAELARLQETRRHTEAELARLQETRRHTEAELAGLRETHGDTAEQLETLRETHRETEAQLAEAREECQKSSRRLASSHAKLRRARSELEIARMPWWRRRRAQDGGG